MKIRSRTERSDACDRISLQPAAITLPSALTGAASMRDLVIRQGLRLLNDRSRRRDNLRDSKGMKYKKSQAKHCDRKYDNTNHR